jgi:single-strand DNA-binding protein
MCSEPELKYGQSGKAICNLRIATNEVYKNKAGEKQEKTEFHRCTLFGDQAENASKYLAKGREVYVEGRLETTSYEKDGIKRFSTSVIADRVVFLGGGQRSDQGEQPSRTERAAPPPAPDDDIPF